MHTSTIVNPELIKAVEQGLGAVHKSLPSWVFYDERGDKIFQQIMRMPEYYPTRCEYEILEHHKEDLLRYFVSHQKPFQLVELGAGDGLKTEILLRYLHAHQVKFIYRPVDISASVLDQLTRRLTGLLPQLDIQPVNKNYFKAVEDLRGEEKTIIFFLGANIGNFTRQEALIFLKNISVHLQGQGLALIGFDLKKDPRIIARAYDDEGGITRAFNLNTLQRLNRELGAQFIISQFDHYSSYDPETGAARSFLVSLKDQDVAIRALQKVYHFAHWETINTEISQKYDLMMIEKILSEAGLEIVDLFFDARHFFCDVLVKKPSRV
jgi:L-histidine Nalpha-methyltransferase